MIDGLAIKRVIVHPTADGFFAELVKFGEETFHNIKQISYSETNAGVIKAFHRHHYWEMWCFVKGEVVVVVYDGRKGSPTFGEIEVIPMGEKEMKVIALPPDVAHGYKVVSDTPAGVIYHAESAYDPKNPGIEEIPYDDPAIGFDWTTEDR